MMENLKKINIGKFIKQKVNEESIEMSRICNFFKCTDKEIEEMYVMESLDANILLKWSKLLKYDFFRLYSQHLIMYSPQLSQSFVKNTKKKSSLPDFRKNIYTREIINFILELFLTGQKTKSQIIEEYNIPKTTLYKWIKKYIQQSE